MGVGRPAHGLFLRRPELIIFGIFILLPMVLNFYYGFTTGQSILLENREFVGTDNLETILNCEDYGESEHVLTKTCSGAGYATLARMSRCR